MFWSLCHPLRGPGRGSMIVGKSVHNQRIERLWRDVFEGVLCIYYHLFYHHEECHVLNPSDELHMFALHYVFVPRINRHLDTWKLGYIHHNIRTASNYSPMQLYILGLIEGNSSIRDDALEPTVSKRKNYLSH